MRILGLDPGLQRTGWGLLDVEGTHLRHVAHGVIASNKNDNLPQRLMQLHDGLQEILAAWMPTEAAVEETFVNKNPVSTLKLGQARGISLLVPALSGIPVLEYAPNHVKKAVVGVGHAGKQQIHAMVAVLLPTAKVQSPDAADALAVAICHAHRISGGEGQRALLRAEGKL